MTTEQHLQGRDRVAWTRPGVDAAVGGAQPVGAGAERVGELDERLLPDRTSSDQ